MEDARDLTDGTNFQEYVSGKEPVGQVTGKMAPDDVKIEMYWPPVSSESELSMREDKPFLIVLIPCLNEEKTIAQVVSFVPRTIPRIDRVEVVVIDDGSTDDTASIAEAAGAVVIRNDQNAGLGKTFRAGIRYCLEMGADYVVNIDGDAQFDPADIPKLTGPLLEGKADMVTASRFIDSSLAPRMPLLKRWGNAWVAWIVSIISGRRFRDVSCGFRAYSREALLRLNLFGVFTYTQETFLDFAFKELEILEVPVSVRGVREFGRSRMASNLSVYGVRALKIMLRAAISYRPFRFFATVAGVFLAAGIGLLGFLFLHYLQSGAFSPHIWAGFVGGSFVFLGLSTIVLGFIGDILVQIRLNQEELLYLHKRRLYSRQR